MRPERFPHVPPVDVARARLVRVPVLTRGVAAMTLGRFILIRRGHERDERLIAHELVHVHQWRALGVRRFVTEYLGAYVRNRQAGMTHWAAYRAIPLEQEARARTPNPLGR